MKANELRQKSKSELKMILSDLLHERFSLRMQKATGQLSKPDQVKRVRRSIARVQTVLNEIARL